MISKKLYRFITLVIFLSSTILLTACKENSIRKSIPVILSSPTHEAMTPTFFVTNTAMVSVSDTPTITATSTSTAILDISKRKITLQSRYDPNFIIENMADPQSLINFNDTNGSFDFDNTVITIDRSADIYLSISCGSKCFNVLVPINKSKAVTEIATQPGYSGCIAALDTGKIRTIGSYPGSYSCLLTNKGKLVEIFIVSNEIHGYDGMIEIEYRVWDNN